MSLGENMMAFQISVLAVGCVRRIGGISVPVTNSMMRKFFVNEQNLLAPVDVEWAGFETFNGRQPRARRIVLSGRTQTGTVQGS